MSLPSGDQAGERLVPPTEGKLTMRPRSSEYMRIWKPSRPSEEKARRLLSGEMRGERETVPRWVIGVLVGAVVVHRPDLFVAAGDA